MNWFKSLLNLIKRLFHIKSKSRYELWQDNNPGCTEGPQREDFTGPSHHSMEVSFNKGPLQGATPAPDPVFSCIEFIGTKLLTGIGAAAWNTFYTEVVNQGVTELTQILEKLSDIQSKLKELTDMYKNTVYEEYINTRSKYVIDMTNAQTYFLQQIKELDADNPETKEVLRKWSETYISGNSAMIQYQNFIDWILQVKVNSNTLYNIYDLYVYNTTPWEHQGYEYREQLRNMDCAAVATNALLSLLYIKSRDDISDSAREMQINTVTQKLKQYYDYFNAHAVVRHTDKIICQIERTHFEMDRMLWTKDYISHSWFKDGTDWDTEHQESAWCLAWGDDYGTVAGNNCGKQLYRAEINRIKNYYSGQNKTLWDIIFGDMGVVMPHVAWITEDQMRIPLATWTGDNPTDFHHRDISFGEVIRKGTDNISEEVIGSAYIEHTGFLWLKLTFRRWDSLDRSKAWHFMNVTSRDKDNWKE